MEENKNIKYIVIDNNDEEVTEDEYKKKYLGYKCHCKLCGCKLKDYKDVNDDIYIVGNHECELDRIKVVFTGIDILDLEYAKRTRKKISDEYDGGPGVDGPIPPRKYKKGYANAIYVDKENCINSAIKLLKFVSTHNMSTSFHGGIMLKDLVVYDKNYKDIIESDKRKIAFLAKRKDDIEDIAPPYLKGYQTLIAQVGENEDEYVVLYVKVLDNDDNKIFTDIVRNNPNCKDFIFVCSTDWRKSEIKVDGALAVYETEIVNYMFYCESTSDFRRSWYEQV